MVTEFPRGLRKGRGAGCTFEVFLKKAVLVALRVFSFKRSPAGGFAVPFRILTKAETIRQEIMCYFATGTSRGKYFMYVLLQCIQNIVYFCVFIPYLVYYIHYNKVYMKQLTLLGHYLPRPQHRISVPLWVLFKIWKQAPTSSLYESVQS